VQDAGLKAAGAPAATIEMQFPQTFVPTARDVGLLPMVTEFSLVTAMLAFAGGFVFLLASKNSVVPWHRSSALLSAVICLVMTASYWLVHNYYHDMLHQLAATAEPLRRGLIRDSYFAIGSYRYMAWAIAFPLLVLRMVMVLKVRQREVLGWMVVLAGAAFWMVLAGFIGDQQIGPDGAVLRWRHSFWGLLGTLGYAVVLWVLFGRMARLFGGNADDEAGHAFRLMTRTTITTWGVYPLGYLASALLPRLDLNWVQIAFTAGDLANLLGVFAVAYLLGTTELERRVPPEAIQPARIVS
jgi:sensory rhodopsin